MIPLPDFQQVEAIPDAWTAACEVCDRDVNAVALVGILDPPERTRVTFGRSRAIICVGPCGHSTIDAGGAYVYRVTFG